MFSQESSASRTALPELPPSHAAHELPAVPPVPSTQRCVYGLSVPLPHINGLLCHTSLPLPWATYTL